MSCCSKYTSVSSQAPQLYSTVLAQVTNVNDAYLITIAR